MEVAAQEPPPELLSVHEVFPVHTVQHELLKHALNASNAGRQPTPSC